MTLIAVTETKALNTLITGVKNSGKAFEAKLHLAAFSCLTVAEGGDIRPIARLYNAMPSTALRVALAAWANAFGKVTITHATDEAPAAVKFGKTKVSDLETAQIIPVGEYKPEVSANTKAFDFAAKLDALIKAAVKNGVENDAKFAMAFKMIGEARATITGENVVTTSNVVTSERKAA